MDITKWKTDPENYFPIVDEPLWFFQKNLMKPEWVSPHLVPWTVYYYSNKKIMIDDNPFSLQGMFDQAERRYDFFTYKW